MRTHTFELENIRNIRRASLDLSAPLTLICGPNGSGKTTVQLAALTTLFACAKKHRDLLIPKQDPDSVPRATMHLSRDEGGATIKLVRTLLGHRGEWHEDGAPTLRGKAQALAKIQEMLPISSDAAGTLLWGQQQRLGEILETFPEDGHSLLTAAMVRGSGPDPIAVIDTLDQAFKEAKRSGKHAGALTLAKQRAADLEEESRLAAEAERQLASLKLALAEETELQRQLSEDLQLDTAKLRKLRNVHNALNELLKHQRKLQEVEARVEAWTEFDGRVVRAQRNERSLAKGLDDMQSQFRIARDRELREDLAELQAKLAAADNLQAQVQQLESQFAAQLRPAEADVERMRELEAQREQLNSRLEANGVRYRIEVTSDDHHVEVVEDGGVAEMVRVDPATPHVGIVGNVEVRSGGVTFTAGGKEDVASLKLSLKRLQNEERQLLDRFSVGDRAAFDGQASQRAQLERERTRLAGELSSVLAGKSLESVRLTVDDKRRQREDIQASADEIRRANEGVLLASSEIQRRLLRKEAELENAKGNMASLSRETPAPEELELATRTCGELRERVAVASADFKLVDGEESTPCEESLVQLQRQRAAAVYG